MAINDYTTIETPYDDFLNRSASPASTDHLFELGDTSGPTSNSDTANAVTDGGTTDNGNLETQAVKSDGSIGDIWIKNFIRSENWQPKKIGFYIDGQTGKAEFSNVYVSGNIQALTGSIGGWTINATNLSAVGIILDSALQQIRVGAGNPYILIDGINTKIESSNYVSGVFGAGFHIDSNLLEVGNIEARGLIRTAVFQKNVVNVMGGNFAVLDGDALDEDMTAWD